MLRTNSQGSQLWQLRCHAHTVLHSTHTSFSTTTRAPNSIFQLVLTQTLPHSSPTPPSKLLIASTLLLPPQPPSLYVRGTLVVRAVQQTDYAEQDGLGSLHGGPSLRGGFVAVLVIFGWVEDGYAEESVWVYIWVEGDRFLEFERGWEERVG